MCFGGSKQPKVERVGTTQFQPVTGETGGRTQQQRAATLGADTMGSQATQLSSPLGTAYGAQPNQ